MILHSMPICSAWIAPVATPQIIGLQHITGRTRALQMKVEEALITAVVPAIPKHCIQPLVLNAIGEIRAVREAEDTINSCIKNQARVIRDAGFLPDERELRLLRNRDLCWVLIILNVHDDWDKECCDGNHHAEDTSRPKPDAYPQPIRKWTCD